MALCYSLYLRRISGVIELPLAICLFGAVLGLAVLRFSTDEQHSRMKAPGKSHQPVLLFRRLWQHCQLSVAALSTVACQGRLD